jgi:uncharacterized protein (DUF2384 family)
MWRWQARFMADGVEGLLHEATHPAGKPSLPAAVIERVVEMTIAPRRSLVRPTTPPRRQTRWRLRKPTFSENGDSGANVRPTARCIRRLRSVGDRIEIP